MSKTGEIKEYKKNKGFEAIPRELLQDHSISGESIHLICELSSYPEGFKIFKTAIYKWREKNKRTQIDRMWNELIEANYLIQFRKREGKKWNYRYIFSLTKFDKEDIDFLVSQNKSEGFEPHGISNVGNQQSNNPEFGVLILNSSKPASKRTLIKREEDEDNNININAHARESLDVQPIKNKTEQPATETETQPTEPIIEPVQSPMSKILTDTGLFDDADIQTISSKFDGQLVTLAMIHRQLEAMSHQSMIFDPVGYFIRGINKMLRMQAFKNQQESMQAKSSTKLKVPMHNWLQEA